MCAGTIEAQYLKLFIVLLLPLMSSLCRIVFHFHAYITMEHTLTFEITFTRRTVIFYRIYKHCFFAYMLNVLTII